MRSSFISLTLAAVFALTFAGSANAETFTAYLTPAQEVPPVASTATGYARFFVNEAAGTCSFTVVFSGLSSNQTASHIHAPAAIGATVGVAINFGAVGGTSGTITGNCTITPTQLAQIRQHLGYVNVHSANFVNGEIRGQLGIPRPVDYDGDGRQDYSVLRFPNIAPPGIAPISYWNLNSTSGPQEVLFGGDANTDFPVPGDYDGDAKGDMALYRGGANPGDPSTFVIFRSSTNTFFVQQYGISGDTAHCRDFDGDGKTDLAVVRPGASATANLTWWIKRSSTQVDYVVPFGLTGDGVNNFDTPVSGDYDGDGKFDIAVYRFALSPANNFIVLRSSDSSLQFTQWGNFNSDYILPGDYDGDGITDLCAARTGATGTSPLTWWIRQSSNGQSRTFSFGRSSDIPVQGDYDGDARTDAAIYRSGATATAQSVFWVFRSFDGAGIPTNWGLGADFAVASFDAR